MDKFLKGVGITPEQVGKQEYEEFKRFLMSWKKNWKGYLILFLGLNFWFWSMAFLVGLLGD